MLVSPFPGSTLLAHFHAQRRGERITERRLDLGSAVLMEVQQEAAQHTNRRQRSSSTQGDHEIDRVVLQIQGSLQRIIGSLSGLEVRFIAMERSGRLHIASIQDCHSRP